MSVVDSSDQSFRQDVPEEGLAVVDFWAPWCGPCRAFAPVFAASAHARPGVRHLKVNVDENPALSEYFSVSSIPTVALIRDGVVLSSAPGALSAPALSQMIDDALALDMADVRSRAEQA